MIKIKIKKEKTMGASSLLEGGKYIMQEKGDPFIVRDIDSLLIKGT